MFALLARIKDELVVTLFAGRCPTGGEREHRGGGGKSGETQKWWDRLHRGLAYKKNAWIAFPRLASGAGRAVLRPAGLPAPAVRAAPGRALLTPPDKKFAGGGLGGDDLPPCRAQAQLPARMKSVRGVFALCAPVARGRAASRRVQPCFNHQAARVAANTNYQCTVLQYNKKRK